jgi:hypothetical protein
MGISAGLPKLRKKLPKFRRKLDLFESHRMPMVSWFLQSDRNFIYWPFIYTFYLNDTIFIIWHKSKKATDDYNKSLFRQEAKWTKMG